MPLTEDEVTAQVANLRLEWLDDQTCFAVYDLQAVVKRQGVQGHFLTVFGWADGWKVTVSSIPG